MHDEVSHGARTRERVAPNVYRRRTKGGEVVYEAMFRDVDGRQRARRLKARSERAAVREARKLLAQRDGNERVTPADVTLSAFWADECLPLAESLAAAGRRSEQGVELDKTYWRLYIEPHLGDLRLGEVTGDNIAAMLRAGRSRKPRPLGESTLKHSLTVLGAVYRLARSRRGADGRPLVTRSPLDELDPGERPRVRTGKRRRLDERELSMLVSHAPTHYRVAVTLLAYTGMRISEACGLRWADVDFVDREFDVAGQLTRSRRNRPARVVPRKSGADPYPALLFPALERVLIDHLAAEQEAGRGADDDFVLATRTGRPPSQRNVARAVTEAGVSAKLGHVTPQTLRRSFASLAARRGVDPVQAAKMTGHSLDVWTRHYAGDYGKPQRDEARARMLEHGFGAADERESDENEPVSR
jgi:integrase